MVVWQCFWKKYFYIIFHFVSSILKFYIAGVKHRIGAFDEIFVKLYKHEVQNNSAQHHTFAELLLVLSNQPSEIKHCYICWHYLCKHTLVVVEWLFCVIFPNLKNLQGINQQYWFVLLSCCTVGVVASPAWINLWLTETRHSAHSPTRLLTSKTIKHAWEEKPIQSNSFHTVHPKGEYTSSFYQS